MNSGLATRSSSLRTRIRSGRVPKAVEAIRAAAGDIHRYPDGASFKLRSKLAGRLDVGEDQLVFGTGCDEVIELIAKTFIGANDEVIYPWPSFAMYPIVVKGMGGTSVEVPLAADLDHDLEAMADAITDQTRVVMVCNPKQSDRGEFLARRPSSVFVAPYPRPCRVGDRRGLRRVRAALGFPRLPRVDRSTAGYDRPAVFFEDLRDRRRSHRLWDHEPGTRELFGAGTTPVQRESAGPGRGGRGPRRPRNTCRRPSS